MLIINPHYLKVTNACTIIFPSYNICTNKMTTDSVRTWISPHALNKNQCDEPRVPQNSAGRYNSGFWSGGYKIKALSVEAQ